MFKEPASMTEVFNGIIIGGAGGAVAGIAVYGIQYLHNKINTCIDTNKIETWLRENTKDEGGARFRSTRAIASWNNLPEDRVRYICSHSTKIYLSTGGKEDMWGTIQRENDFPDEFISG